MNIPPLPALTTLQNPAVRHLVWLLHSPQLISGTDVFVPGQWLTEQMLERLLTWNSQPETAPALLQAIPPRRLGLYFESLYAVLMVDLLGWHLLARNLPIRERGRTLGELDFVLLNPHSGEIEHHEVAIKFYLGYAASVADPVLWYGPNPHDRLDLKSANLRDQQIQRSASAVALDVLAAQGIGAPVQRRLCMPGYLFYPLDRDINPPSQADAGHCRGSWLYRDQVHRLDTVNWLPLHKPHWIGPWVDSQGPDPQGVQAGLQQIDSSATPRLFARLQRTDSGLWCEVERFFVVPPHWPKDQPKNQ